MTSREIQKDDAGISASDRLKTGSLAMKISIDVDCTPEEARAFLGLPDVTPLNEAFVVELQKRIQDGFSTEELDGMMQAWTKSATTGMGELQRGFWSMMQQSGMGGTKPGAGS